ncbi:hypothetical protein N9515_00825 [Vicingaceae bacterium]|nr:hypothetical protein [Vicingaceae bacterium]
MLNEKTEYFLRTIKEEYISEISIYCFFSIILIFSGYTFFYNYSVKPLSSRESKFSNSQLRNLTILFIIIGILYRIGEKFSPDLVAQLSNLIQILFFAPSIVLALYTLYLLRAKSKFKIDLYHLFVILFIAFEFLLRLSTTLMVQVFILFFGGLLAYFSERKKLPMISIIIASLILMPLYQARKYFRVVREVETFGSSELAIGSQILKQTLSSNSGFDNKLSDFSETAYNKEHNRFENLSYISHVVLQHKRGSKSFLLGETFYWLPLVPIPRIIFPAKPVNDMSTGMATNYGVRGEFSNASINFPMLIEGYINFGFNGMLIMAFIFGLSMKWFVMKFGAGIGDLNLIIIINSMKHFVHAEGNITLVFGALIQIYLFWWVLINVFKVGVTRERQ